MLWLHSLMEYTNGTKLYTLIDLLECIYNFATLFYSIEEGHCSVVKTFGVKWSYGNYWLMYNKQTVLSVSSHNGLHRTATCVKFTGIPCDQLVHGLDGEMTQVFYCVKFVNNNKTGNGIGQTNFLTYTSLNSECIFTKKSFWEHFGLLIQLFVEWFGDSS